MIKNLIFILAILYSNNILCQKKTLLLSTGPEYMTLTEDMFSSNSSLINIGVGMEVLVNHDVSMGFRVGIIFPKTNLSIYDQSTISFTEYNEKLNGFIIQTEPFKYNFSQDLKGIYMSLNALLFLTNEENISNEISLPDRKIISSNSYMDNDKLFAGGLKFGYKAWINNKFGLDFSTGIYLSEDEFVLPIGLKLNYNLK